MSKTLSNQENNQTLSFSFQPPPGGDVWLRSSDGTDFVVHSMFLGFSSKVFSDMLITSTKSDVIELAEDAEAISLMLAFLYPMVHPAIDSAPLLEKAMLMAHKYDIDVLVKTVEQASGRRDLIRQNPLRIYQAAGNYGFEELEFLSAKLITQSHYDMTTVQGLVNFAKEYPDLSRIIGLVGVHGARVRVLDAFRPKNSVILWPSRELYEEPKRTKSGGSCWLAKISCGLCGRGDPAYKPGWLDCWFDRLRSALADKLVDECSSFFTISYLMMLRGEDGCCESCVDAARRETKAFERWADKARSRLEEELAKLDVLYALDLS
ncbi:hypothetical protein FRC09_009364 [Ceratobasidium sp. 395]|nr:hypothetical protein FRC09_009364 [Ceratobasidium sp. 395]